MKSFLPSMLERNHGHIVSISSAAGVFGVTGLADYSASKSAVLGFDDSLRDELVSLGKVFTLSVDNNLCYIRPRALFNALSIIYVIFEFMFILKTYIHYMKTSMIFKYS